MSKRHPSRADRASEQAGQWTAAAEELRELDSEVEELGESKEEAKLEDILGRAQSIVSGLDTSELTALAEEMGSWRDNLQGTNLENTSKYSEVEETVDTLESIDDSIPSIESVDDIEGAADDLESKAEELEGVSFPGMY